MTPLSTQQIIDAQLDDWRKLAQALHARYRVPDAAAAARFLAALAEAGDRFPEVTFAGDALDLAVGTRQDGLWVTAGDVEYARRISDLARRHGLTPEPSGVAQVEFGLDTAHDDRLGPFWSALLTGSEGNIVRDTVLDPTGRLPNVWFQGTDEHEPPRQRWHPDVWLAPEAAQPRIAAALAAGGTVVDDSDAPSYTVLADPDGNKVCVCTFLDRG